MGEIVAVRYKDALYFREGEIFSGQLPVYVAVGNLIDKVNHLLISFTKENGVPTRGLLIPKESLILDEKDNAKHYHQSSLNIKKGQEIGVFWRDIVYFEKGKIPNTPTEMYTRGKFVSQTSEFLLIDKPETVKVWRKTLEKHPKDQVAPIFCVIPRVVIIKAESYE